MPEIVPMTEEEANTPLPEGSDLSGFSDEDIDAALESYGNDGTAVGALADSESEYEPEPEPEPEVEIEVVADAEAPDDEPEPVAAEADDAAPEAVEEPEPPNELDEIRSMVEISTLEAEKAKTELERWRLLADQNAGKVAHLEQLMNTREARADVEPGDEYREPAYDDRTGAQDRAAVVPSELQSELSEIRAERVRRALEQQGLEFQGRHREFFETLGKQDDETRTAFNEDFNAELKTQAESFRDALTGADAKLAAVSARTAYDSAIIEAKIRMTKRGLDASRTRREEAKAKLIEQKRAAAPTQGQAPPSPEVEVNKPLHELSNKELNAQIRSLRF